MMAWLFTITGAIGFGYGLSTLIRQHIEVYSFTKRDIVSYTGKPAQVVSIGLITASAAILILAVVGFALWPLVVVIAGAYYGGIYLANRMQKHTDEVA
jgi:hypothetical protein